MIRALILSLLIITGVSGFEWSSAERKSRNPGLTEWSSAERKSRNPGLILSLLIVCALVCASPVTAADDDLARCTFAVSPDGEQVAYQSPVYDEYADPATSLWVADLDGSNPKHVASVPGAWSVQWLGKDRLVCTQWDNNRIPVIAVDTGKESQLSLTDGYYWATPSISPDGGYVAFNAVQKEPREVGVFLLNSQTGKIKRVSSDVVKSYVAWSPDSKKIVYGEGAYQSHYKIKIIDVESANVTDTGLDGVGVEFSPDGKWVAYTGKIVRGGSWYSGVPCDGRIMKTNLETKETIALTESAYNANDEQSKRWEMRGAIYPKWSPDGKRIAYRKRHFVKEGNKDTLNLDEIWVVNADGSGAQKVRDKWTPYVWSPDSGSILAKLEDGIERIPVDVGKATKLVVWKVEKPDAAKLAEGSLAADGARAEYKGVRPEYAKALLAVAAEARRIYADQFKFVMPAEVQLHIEKDPEQKTVLWNDGQSEIFLTVKSNSDLAPPMKSGYFNIYGMCHELGHIAMYRSIKMIGLPDGVGEGWAHYAGSVVVDEVAKKLGKDIYPEPYDVAKTEGTARLDEQSKDSEAAKSSVTKAAAVFRSVDLKYGTDKVMSAMNSALEGKPYGKDLMPRFADALAKVTGDQSAAALVPKEMLTPKVEWKVADREITDKAVEGIIQEKDDTGVLLRYDDGSSDGMRSTAGAGHAVVFRTPPGAWAVDYVQMYGSRYGEGTPPDEDFSVFICDKDFGIIKEIAKPYSLLERGDPKWYKLEFDPVKLPEGFYVCIYFNPTATKGFYMHYDKSPKKIHSKAALPYTFVHDLGDDGSFEWMIRVHLVEAR